MAPEGRRSRSRRAWTTLVAVVVVVAAVAGTAWWLWPDEERSSPDSEASSEHTPPPKPTPIPRAHVRIATFNVLGHGHTRPRGTHPNLQPGPKRMRGTKTLLDRHRVEIAGLQEFEAPQFERFERIAGDEWDVFPGEGHPPVATAQAVIWRTDRWRLVESHLLDVPYFSGNTRPNPYVLLESIRTGDRIWVWNTHNPANVRGSAEQARDRGYRMEARLIRRLQRNHPGVPVVSLGDKNLGGDFICSFSRRVDVHSADGGRAKRSGGCTRPKDPIIDWIVGTPDVRFRNYTRVETGLVEKVSDHRFVFADVQLPRPS